MAVTYNVGDLINNLIQLEACGNAYYSRLAEFTEKPLLNDLFQKLAGQELQHKKFYQKLLAETNIEVEIEEDYHAYLQTIIDEKFDLKLDQDKAEVNLNQAIDNAMKLEKDTLRFLDEFEKLIGKLHQDVIQNMKAQENEHLRLLQEYKQELGN
jgi:rubrerythrin